MLFLYLSGLPDWLSVCLLSRRQEQQQQPMILLMLVIRSLRFQFLRGDWSWWWILFAKYATDREINCLPGVKLTSSLDGFLRQALVGWHNGRYTDSSHYRHPWFHPRYHLRCSLSYEWRHILFCRYCLVLITSHSGSASPSQRTWFKWVLSWFPSQWMLVQISNTGAWGE